MTNNRIPTALFRRLGVILLIIIAGLLLVNFAGNFFYIFNGVEEQEVGVQFRNRQIVDVVGPGVYSDVGLFVELKPISVQAIAFTVQDEEIITADKQRIGLIVTGDIFRFMVAIPAGIYG
jgi:4-hydroxyphenylpyruvate dioxygenase-like putative hemolysin